MRPVSSVRSTAIGFALAALVALSGIAAASGGPGCTITGPATPTCGPAQLCGPDGNYSYYWARPFGGIEFTQCITAIESGGYVLWITDLSTGLQGEPCFFKFDSNTPVPCDITGPDQFCAGSKATLCGPDGPYLYSWSGPLGFTAASRCVDVINGGDYSLTVSNLDGTCPSTCKHSLAATVCVINCPRTVGYWGQQCAQKGNGSTKFTKAQVTSIASCVDGKAAIFNWGANSFNGFCAAMSTSDMSQRVQAKRQFAGLLANICVGNLGLVANNGDHVKLSTETIVSCGGTLQSIGDLVASVDAQLVSLEGQNLSSPSVASAYSAIITCLDAINNGRGIGAVCPELTATSTLLGSQTQSRTEPVADLSLGTMRAYPNPFRGLTTLSYAVAPEGENVSIGVYDIAGRTVKHLFSGFQTGGVHTSNWDATDEAGAHVRTGMYFIRGRVGERQVASRAMLVR